MNNPMIEQSNNKIPNAEFQTPNSKLIQPATIKLDGTNLIEASAGTGKTYTISSLFLRCIAEGIRIDQILVVTFTIAATAELKERIRKRLNLALLAIEQKLSDTDDEMIALILGYPPEKRRNIKNKIKHALSGFDEAAIFTIHSFCLSMLQENAFESGALFDTELSADSRSLYEEIALDFWAREFYNAHPLFIRYLNDCKITPDNLIQMIHKTASQPNLVILPQKNEKSEIEHLYLDAFRTACDILQNDEKEIKTLLESHPGVNRRSYNKGTISRWLNAIRQYLTSSEPSYILTADDDNSVYKFTNSRLWEKTKAGCDPPVHPFFDACQKLVETGSLFAQKWLVLKRRFIEYSETELARRKQDAGVWFFDDLILNLHDALNGPEGEPLVHKIRSRYQAVLIDEFQDTDHVQYNIFRKIFQTEQPENIMAAGPALFLIGDPKQSIYAFRGADIFAYLKAIADAGENIFTLPTNWRSDPRLIDAVNTIFSRIERPFWYPQIDFKKVSPKSAAVDGFFINNQPGPPLTIQFIQREDKKTNLITKGWAGDHLYRITASDIVRLLSGDAKIGANGGRTITPGDIAVLTRTNFQAARMQDALRELKVPSVLTSDASVFDSPQAAELQEVLEAVNEPRSYNRPKTIIGRGKIRNALSGPLFGLNSTALQYLDKNDAVYEKLLMQFHNWHKRWRNDGFIRMIRSLLAFKLSAIGDESVFGVQTVAARQLSLDNGERCMTNLLHLIELLHEASVQNHLGPASLMRHFKRLRQTRTGAQNSELRLESDTRAVKLITLHKSKGLEFPVVFCPFLWDGKIYNDKGNEALFHDPDDNRQPKFDIGSEALKKHQQIARTEEIAENLRLLYVALTRAKHHCVVVWGAINDMQTSSLGYVLHSQGADRPDDLADVAEYVGSLSDDALRDDLNRLAIASDGAIKIETSDETECAPFQPETEQNYDLSVLQTQRTLRWQWQISSFSGLTAHGTELSPDEAEGRDRDSVDATSSVRSFYKPPEVSANALHPITLTGFGGGFQVGDMLHAIYENLDFQYDKRQTLETLVREQLDRFSFDAVRWQPTVSRAIEENIHTRLDPDEPELCLSEIAMGHRFNELEFLFPVSNRYNPNESALTGHALAAVFAENGAADVSQHYINRLKRLSFAPLKGFLKGFIDLIFQYKGRWYVVDYKSNFLGEQYQDYTVRYMADTMAEHHYYLQYHIYTVALHRLLSHRIKDYDYNIHFGKVYYLFLRGMSPHTGPEYGVFSDRPAAKLIKALSDLFGNGD